ncbi:hypothetical protein ACWCP6_24480 [Streptomyces sp. NPDC002004]
MSLLTPARALTLVTSGLTCLTTAAGGLAGALLGSWDGALVGAACTGMVSAAAAVLVRRRALVKFALAQEAARKRGYAEAIAQGVLIQVVTYQAAVFPHSGPGAVTDEERAARRMIAYRMAALDDVPRAVREAAATALAMIDEVDRRRTEDAVTELAVAVHDHTLER